MSEFWRTNAGIEATPNEVQRAAAADTEARAKLSASSLAAEDVSALLQMPVSEVQRSASDRTLYSYLSGDRLMFPGWQFSVATHKAIPHLPEVLSALPSDLHPQAVAGFFLTPQPDLIMQGQPVSAKDWLEAGGDKDAVCALADGLAGGY